MNYLRIPGFLLLLPLLLAATPRLVVLTDIGGDPDDQQSLVRLLVYADQFDIEGIICEHWVNHDFTPQGQVDLVHKYIDAYAEVRPNLMMHVSGFPPADRLHQVVKRGLTNVVSALDTKDNSDIETYIGPNKDTEGSRYLVDIIKKDDPRPVNISIWGGSADLAQALWRLREAYIEVDFNQLLSKIRVHAISDQDLTGPWIRDNFPGLFYIFDHARDGNKWNSVYRGMFLGGDETLTSRKWIETHVRKSHAALGALYPAITYTGKNKHSALKEGDTPSWFYFLENGLNEPARPQSGGWGGRFEKHRTFFQDAVDHVDGETSGRATVWRWRPDFQAEFQARMDWCIRSENEANHPPIAVLNGQTGTDPVFMSVNAGENVNLDASASHDPDGNKLSYDWCIYREAGSCEEEITIVQSHTPQAFFIAPNVPGKSLHVILRVIDDGEPALVGYKRIVISLQ